MKKISEENEIKLLEYIDGTLNAEASADLIRQMEQQPELKARLLELQGLNAYFAGNAPASPAKNFTQKVMSRLDHYPGTAGAPIWKNVVLLAGIVVTACLAAWLVSLGIFDSATQVDLNSVVFRENPMRESLPRLRFDGKTIVNSIVIFNLVIAFLLLDRAVFRPWFQRRSRLHL